VDMRLSTTKLSGGFGGECNTFSTYWASCILSDKLFSNAFRSEAAKILVAGVNNSFLDILGLFQVLKWVEWINE